MPKERLLGSNVGYVATFANVMDQLEHLKFVKFVEVDAAGDENDEMSTR